MVREGGATYAARYDANGNFVGFRDLTDDNIALRLKYGVQAMPRRRREREKLAASLRPRFTPLAASPFHAPQEGTGGEGERGVRGLARGGARWNPPAPGQAPHLAGGPVTLRYGRRGDVARQASLGREVLARELMRSERPGCNGLLRLEGEGRRLREKSNPLGGEGSATLRRPILGRDVVKIRERVLDDFVNYLFNAPSYLGTTFIERRVIGNLDLIKICVVRLRQRPSKLGDWITIA